MSLYNVNVMAVNQLIDQVSVHQQKFQAQFLKQCPYMLEFNLRQFKNHDLALMVGQDRVIDWYAKVVVPYQKALIEYDNQNTILLPMKSIRSRIKSNMFDKMINFMNTPFHLVAVKTLNDIYGCRLILPNLREFETRLLTNLKVNDKVYRVVTRYDDENANRSSKYHGIHVYLQKHNYELPWEVQIWDSADEATNLSDHLNHEQRKGY